MGFPNDPKRYRVPAATHGEGELQCGEDPLVHGAETGDLAVKLEPTHGSQHGEEIVVLIVHGHGLLVADAALPGAGPDDLALDLGDDTDKATLARLVAHADVVVENFRPNVMPGLGFAADELITRHPRLIYVAIRGFPGGTKLANAPTYDHVIQATTGFAANLGVRASTPVALFTLEMSKIEVTQRLMCSEAKMQARVTCCLPILPSRQPSPCWRLVWLHPVRLGRACGSDGCGLA